MHLELIAAGIVMGTAFAAPPGAVLAETLRRGARGGFGLALGVQLGSLVGDATYALAALAGLAAIAQVPALQVSLGALGAMFLMYLAWTSFEAVRLSAVPESGVPIQAQRRGAFLSGMAISLTNPWAIAFWLSLGGALTTFGVVGSDPQNLALFFLSFMLGSAAWAFLVAAVIARVRRWMRPAVMRLLSVGCGIALGTFGVMAAARVIVSIIGV
ncbi:MAG: LysE family transporter [Chloroflexi bacterium]|nr:LysE family transporter [Chloroflexota bacterium]